MDQDPRNTFYRTNDAVVHLQPDKQDSVDSDDYVRKSNRTGKAVRQRSIHDVSRRMEQSFESTQTKQSLAESLRQRREFMEHIEHERAQHGRGNSFGGGKPMSKSRFLPGMVDESGASTSIRIRNQISQTPRINLLKMSRKAVQDDITKTHPLFSQQAQLPKKPPNYLNPLNPNTKIGFGQPIAANYNTAKQFQAEAESLMNTQITESIHRKSSPRKVERHQVVVKQVASIEEESKVEEVGAEQMAELIDNFDTEIVADTDVNGRKPMAFLDDRSDSDVNVSFEEAKGITNMQDHFMEIMNNEEVEDVMDLNEKFLAMALGGIDVSELALLKRLELRVDTTCHSLQVTGEILPSLEYLSLNDSMIRSFRDLGTSFKNVRVLQIARCELKEVQGIQAFEQLEELYLSYNCIDDLFDVSLAGHLQVLDMEGNNVSDSDQLKYLRRMPRLAELNLKANPVAQTFPYYQKIKEVLPKLQSLDDEQIGESFDLFVEEKQKESRRLSMQPKPEVGKQFESALSAVLALFSESVGLNREHICSGDMTLFENTCTGVIQKLTEEPDEEVLLTTQIKSQDKEQKAQQSYENNMDLQGFGGTSQGFYGTHASGFHNQASVASLHAQMRPQSVAFNQKRSMNHAQGSTTNLSSRNHAANQNMTEAGDAQDEQCDEIEEQRRHQMAFAQSMHQTSMSFFKTAKSTTFMSTNDLSLEHQMTDSYKAWGAQLQAKAEAEREEQSDLAGNADHVVAGGSMSILRRRGKTSQQTKNERETKGFSYNSELLSTDILNLLQVYHDKANQGRTHEKSHNLHSDASLAMLKRSQSTLNTQASAPSIKQRPMSGKRVRPGSGNRRKSIDAGAIQTNAPPQSMTIQNTASNPATSIKDPRLAAVASILEKKKIADDGSKVMQGSGSVSLVATANTGEKLEKLKRGSVNMVGNSGAPVKAKLMTVKLKPSQVQFKTAETKVIKKDQK